MLEVRSSENQTVEVEVEGPPMSATYSQLILLARAFGADISKLPAEATTKFLLDVQDAANRGGKVRKASVKGGWVKFVEGANPPAEAYTWEFKGFRTPDGSTPVQFQEKEQAGNNGSFVRDFAYADFVIVGDRYELESPYNGYKLSIKINNPFDGKSLTSRAGTPVPSTKIGQKGGVPVDVVRFKEFCATFCPTDFFRHEWVGDVERSEFGINELENPLAVVDAYARRVSKRALVKLEFNKYGFPTLDVSAFIPARSSGESKVAVVQQPSELEAFYNYVTKKYGKDTFSPTDKNSNEINLEFTPTGVVWAKETLVPIWDRLELPIKDGKRYINTLTPEQLVSLTNELRKLNGERPELTEADGIDSF